MSQGTTLNRAASRLNSVGALAPEVASNSRHNFLCSLSSRRHKTCTPPQVHLYSSCCCVYIGADEHLTTQHPKADPPPVISGPTVRPSSAPDSKPPSSDTWLRWLPGLSTLRHYNRSWL